MLKERLQEILELRDMRPSELSKQSGISSGLLSEVLSGKRDNISLATLKRMADTLGIDVKFFLEPDIIGPTEILSHLSEKDKTFVIDPHNAPFIALTAEAARKGLTPKQLDYLIRAVVENSE